MSEKFFWGTVLGCVFSIMGGFWIFNHINPWLGIILPLVIMYFLIRSVIKKVNK